MRASLILAVFLAASYTSVLSVALVTGCGASATSVAARRATSVSVIAIGNALATAHVENQNAFRVASDAIIIRIAMTGGSVEDYNGEAAPLEHAFLARSRALVALDSALYAAAGVIDALERDAGISDPSALAPLAQTIVDAIERCIVVLEDGSILPAVHIPTIVRTALSTLRTAAGWPSSGGVSDAGT